LAFVTGLLLIDAPASALNNAGADARAVTDNAVAVKKIRTATGIYPYVSAQAFRYWHRTTLENNFSQWVAAPVFREGKIAYPDANPIRNWDDDLFGYMRAPSKKADTAKDTQATPLDRDITRVSPYRVSTLVAVSPSPIQKDFGTMTRQNGDPVPHEHEFYQAHLQGLLSLDLTAVGTFFDTERVGFRNLDSHRRTEAQDSNCQEVTVRKQKAWRLPIKDRCLRAATLIKGLGDLNGGAKQTIHYTDLIPAVIIIVISDSGNHPFYRIFQSSKTHQTIFSTEAFEELIKVYQKDFLSKVYVGWAKGFLDDERAKMIKSMNDNGWQDTFKINHPREIINDLANELNNEANARWYE